MCLKWLLTLTGFGTTKSSVDRCVLGSFIIAATLVFIVAWLPIAIPGFRGARIARAIASTSEPTIFSHTKAGH